MTQTVMNQYQDAARTLEAAGQAHVLRFYDELDDAGKAALLDQIQSVDWHETIRLIETHVKHKPEFKLPEDVQPAPWYPNVPSPDQAEHYRQARALGESLIHQGKVAAFAVAGGQGTRLGWPGPKGTFPATPVRHLSLFGVFAEYIRKVQQKFGCAVPWYIMTSPINDADTRRFFDEHDYFGLDPANVMIFPQGMMPAIDRQTGKVLLASKGELALSPNGHGGSLKALYTSGAIADMQHRGIEQISYIQVDNPNVKVIDPLFIGLHALNDAQMSSKMLPKREPLEKLGNFCLVDGRVTVIEYSDLPETLARERLADGQLRFLAGSIAIHVLRVDFVASLNAAGGFGLPFHRAEKKVPHVDVETGETVAVEAPNAVKLETFVFDALPMCERSIIYETDRLEEFAPIKNADAPPGSASGPGNQDCPATSKLLQTERAAKWLEANGIAVPRDADGHVDATIEISPLTAIEAEDLAGVKLPKIAPGDRVMI